MEKAYWKVEGITCSSCALTISKFLQKEGLQEISVNPIDGSVSFSYNKEEALDKLKLGLKNLGYPLIDQSPQQQAKKPWLNNNKSRFLFTLPFTFLLLLHMAHQWLPVHWLMNPWVQISLCLPVFFIGMRFFGKSAVKSLQNGSPNMNVLVSLGALSAFTYSLVGFFYFQDSNYLFFETTASIITLVFLGNFLEESTVQSTQRALKSLVKSQKLMANMIAFDDLHQEQIFPIENTQLKIGDLILIRTGEQIPIDCKILWGEATVNESIITGESSPIAKLKKDLLIGGSMLENGVVKAQVTVAPSDTLLAGIVKMVQTAQSEKPPMQKVADKISAVFVPIVIVIALLTFLINYFIVTVSFDMALMRAIAVLVISCPCAMGLATPAAIAVGMGRAAKKGILFRNATSLESFKSIKQVVFDKTGTLTTGKFEISSYSSTVEDIFFKELVYSLEKFSTHPIAVSIATAWKSTNTIKWKSIEEIKGRGVKATDMEGNIFEAGSYLLLPNNPKNQAHNVFILKNNLLLGWIDVKDEIRPEAKKVIEWLHRKKIKTLLLTGDTQKKAEEVAQLLGIKEIFAQQSPSQKMEKIAALNKLQPTAMVGDGINDAPALANATVGISLSDASQLALQHADVVLMNQGLKNLPEALSLGRHTYLTIQQNLFWAFAYNVIAIPIAAAGFLTPAFSALAMGLSDVVLAINSIRLFVKKVL